MTLAAFPAVRGARTNEHVAGCTPLRAPHPERGIDSSTGIIKIELVRYYGLVGEMMMAHPRGRPVSLVRAPSGVDGQLFFQKHAENGPSPCGNGPFPGGPTSGQVNSPG